MTKEQIDLLKQMMRKYGKLSTPWIQYKFLVGFKEAERIRKKYNPRITDG